MATIHDLNKSISAMSIDEACILLKGIRENRRVRKVKAKKPKALNMEKMLSGISPEMAKIMLRRLNASK